MQTDLTAEITTATNIYGQRLYPNAQNVNDAVARYSLAMPAALQYMTDVSLSNTQIMSQTMLANSLKRGLTSFASEADASAAVQDFALAQTNAQQSMSFSGMGRIAMKWLPIIRGLIEAFIYAIFPLVAAMMLLPMAGRVILGYVSALFWINLWAPLYAILHFAISYYSRKAGMAAIQQPSTAGVSIMTYTGLGNTLGDYAIIAGYLSA